MDDVQQLTGTIADIVRTVGLELTSLRLLLQFGLILLAAIIGTVSASLVRRRIDLPALTLGWPPFLREFTRLLLANLGTVIFVAVVAIMHAVMLSLAFPSRSYLLGVASSLATAWVVIALVAGLIRNPFVYRLVAVSAWTIAALSILGLLTPTMTAFDSFAVVIGGLRVTPLLVIKTAVLLMLTLWAANWASDFLDRRVRSTTDLTPSIQVLIGKVIRLLLITFAILIVLSTVGIDFSALALFSGAIGVGLGFGLQKIVSNLVSGIILLADKSIKPGDVISVGDHFGRVGNMGARYTSVDTRDGREFLIPNEDFITQRVANWTYSNDLVRLFVKFNTTYDSDPRQAQAAAVDAALSIERVLKKPVPACMLCEFGTTSIEFELWFWIKDPAAGVTNVKSDVLLALWDTLAKQGVKIPKPGPARVIYELAQNKPTGGSDAPPEAKSPFPP
ncbi:MAG: mechanosensitive ion channel [Pseudolabrys sp.]|nr:mechanosensitive ion channel [Pseudolabrys sp.]MSP31324.1 mechanosensitive ion channel [Pseudolabrys sp.]